MPARAMLIDPANFIFMLRVKRFIIPSISVTAPRRYTIQYWLKFKSSIIMPNAIKNLLTSLTVKVFSSVSMLRFFNCLQYKPNPITITGYIWPDIFIAQTRHPFFNYLYYFRFSIGYFHHHEEYIQK